MTAPNRLWGIDITALWGRQEGWLKIAIVVYLFSRKVVGWACAASMPPPLVLRAFQMARGRRQPKHGLLHHPDRGRQYALDAYQQQLLVAEMIRSMSGARNCYDNAVVERVFRSLKGEDLPEHQTETREPGTTLVIGCFKMFYNRQPLHSTLGYQSPNTFAAQAAGDESGDTQVWAKERAGREEQI